MLAGVVLLSLGAAHAADFNYEVRIDAPDPLKKLLEDNLELLKWRGNPRIDADQLQRLSRAAPEQIKALVATEGYYSPEISLQIDKQAAAWQVNLRVVPGKPALVSKVDIELIGFVPSQDAAVKPSARALRASWALKPGQVFRQADWESAKRGLLRQVVLTRFPQAQLTDSSAVVDPDTQQVELKVVLDSGPSISFGALSIEGLKRYPADIINSLNPIKPGDFYDEAALLELQARLQDSGYFSRVEVHADTHGPEAVVPVVVSVEENTRKKIGLGVGYSTDTGNRGQLTYEDLSLLGLKLKTALTLETKKQSARGDLFFPVTPGGDRDSLGLAVERTDISGEVTNLSSLAAKRIWGTPALERSLTLEFLTERKNVAGLDTRHSKSLPLTYGVTLRRTNNLLFPTSGYLLNAQLGGAPLPVLTDRAFLRGYTKLASYHALSRKSTLVLRGELGAVASKSTDGIPDAYLFRAGGDQSVRGYGYQQLGVHDGAAIVGGRYLAVASAEYQYWLLKNWGAAVFYDAGNAADSVRELRPQSGYGVGARWKSPVGPVNLDLAYGRAVKAFRLHFSLGFAF